LFSLHNNSIRLAPPLVISEEDLKTVVQTIRESLEELSQAQEIPGEQYKAHGKPFAAL
jgi:acetylornithine/succinyldiaminopimelate/putrescine aminotransferase